MSATRVPIEPSEIRVGDRIRWEAPEQLLRGGHRQVAVEFIADEAGMSYGPGQHYLLEQPEPGFDPIRDLPEVPTPGWLLVDGEQIPGVWMLHRSSSRRTGEELVSVLQPERDLFVQGVDGFVEGVLIEKAAAERLLADYPPEGLDERVEEPVDEFVRAYLKEWAR